MRIIYILILASLFTGCSGNKLFSKKTNPSKRGVSKILKNPDPAYKLRMAEQFFAKKQYLKAQQVYEDVMPYYKLEKEFEDINGTGSMRNL